MGAWENKCQISENFILRIKFSELYLYFYNFTMKFDIDFVGLPWGIFFGVITDD